MRNEFIGFAVISSLFIALLSLLVWPNFWWAFVVVGPIILLGLYDMIQKKHAIMRNYPILGRGRYLMEEWRPKLYQYFIESDTNGTPISRINRSVVYQRAKKVLDTSPFGTQLNVYDEGYEWMNHSIIALPVSELDPDPRVVVGDKRCSQPYSASILNVSAMSFGSLSKNAILALNGGARLGNFAHNTGEGGISPYHREPGGDLIYQIGTGYFGSRTPDGRFSPERFREQAGLPQVKMIELKLSQGAKPGHGGILPAGKNTPEIAAIRGVEPGTEVLSPPGHTAFSTPIELLEFVQELRELSGGKPVGFKLCIGQPHEFFAMAKAMVKTQLFPDFIAVDGGEGGTGAAPLEFSNSVGMPFRDGLAHAHNVLQGFGIREEVKVFASGKITNGFDLFRAFALGADACYSARAMMLALGCIQALECNKNVCPTGVATQDPELVQGLVVADKKFRVANYHKETVHSLLELLASAGMRKPSEARREYIFRRVSMNEFRTYEEIFPYLPVGCMLQEETVPELYLRAWRAARPESFARASPAMV